MDICQNFQTKCWLAKYHYTGSKPANHGGGGDRKDWEGGWGGGGLESEGRGERGGSG
jgi:hypothetical protein